MPFRLAHINFHCNYCVAKLGGTFATARAGRFGDDPDAYPPGLKLALIVNGSTPLQLSTFTPAIPALPLKRRVGIA